MLERFLYEGGAKLHMDTPDVLYVEYKEDRWRLEPTDRNRKYLLYHNNYTILNDNERYITDSFHKQSQNIDKVADWFWYTICPNDNCSSLNHEKKKEITDTCCFIRF